MVSCESLNRFLSEDKGFRVECSALSVTTLLFDTLLAKAQSWKDGDMYIQSLFSEFFADVVELLCVSVFFLERCCNAFKVESFLFSPWIASRALQLAGCLCVKRKSS